MMALFSRFLYDIRVYRLTTIVSLVLLLVLIPFTISHPEDEVIKVVNGYFSTVINDMNISRAITYTTGQLRHNLSQYQDRIESSIALTGYDGSIRSIDIQILDLRDYYSRVNVVVVAHQSFLYASHLTVERHFDVELTRVDNEWKIMSAIQRRLEYHLWD